MGSGNNRVTGPNSIIGGGGGNLVANNSSGVLGGQNNQILATSNWAAILGGQNNLVTGASQHSAILGGIGNQINGFQRAGVFGQNINAVANNTFHVNCLNARDTPIAGAFPTGTIMWKSCTALVPADRVLVIAP